jgi:hypothetical protein
MKHTAAALAIASTLTLGGCAMTTPSDPGPQKTGQQLRAQLIADATAAITASGLPDGWAFGPEPGARPWNPDADEFIGSSCSTANGETRRRFRVPLYHPSVGDPVAFVQMMGDYWTEQGYIVSLVGDPILAPADRYAENRADRADGSLAAGAAAQNHSFVLTFYTECSTDPTLKMFAGPRGYREFDMLDPDPYYPTDSPTITPYPDH